jgi:hypothetical protein
MRLRIASVFACVPILACVAANAQAAVMLDKPALALDVGDAEQLHATGAVEAQWISSDPAIAQVFSNGFVVGLKPGNAKVSVGRTGEPPAVCQVNVVTTRRPLVDPATLRQFSDNRRFEVNGRKCFGSELNGQRADDPEEHRNLEANRIINPSPLNAKDKLEWEVADGTEIFDGAGVLMGTVAPTTDSIAAGGKKVPSSKFNFGMSKVLKGRMCLYAFAVDIIPTPQLRKIIAPSELSKDGTVGTSAWLPLERVVQKEVLLERAGVGKVKLPRLPLQEKGYKITGGDPLRYMTEFGELRIVKDPDAAPVPSHYLKRPSGTVNIIYSVPGFGLGGQGLDSFLITDGIGFRPARGAKVFVQPTYYPGKHPKRGQVSPRTMTFIYGAAEVKGVEPVYGWVAKEALAAN